MCIVFILRECMNVYSLHTGECMNVHSLHTEGMYECA